ncbi:MAG TPA: copper transporter [Marmoricola sp.]|nr:copper transporter [Marmoricola sp.]
MRPWLVRAAVAALAVALGIGIGAGPLQRSNKDRDEQLAAQKAQVARKQARIDALESGRAFADGFATAVAPTLLRGALAGRAVTVITLPGADPDVVAKLRADLGIAQARVTGQVDLAPSATRSSGRQLVDALTSQMLTQARDVTVPADAGGYERLGALLARALGTGRTGQPVQASYDATAVGIVSGLQSAELVTTGQAISARAGLALVVAGPPARSEAAAADNGVPVTILRALGSRVPTVVVGSTGAAGPLGVLRALRSGAPVLSTVDSVETTMGQVAGVLALAARVRSGTIGQFGAVHAANGALPGATH